MPRAALCTPHGARRRNTSLFVWPVLKAGLHERKRCQRNMRPLRIPYPPRQHTPCWCESGGGRWPAQRLRQPPGNVRQCCATILRIQVHILPRAKSPNGGKSGQPALIWPNPTQFRQKFAQTRPNSAESRPTVPKLCPPDSARGRPYLARPTSTKMCTESPKCGPASTNFDQDLPGIHRDWANSTTTGPVSTKFVPTSNKFDQVWPGHAQIWPEIDQIGPDFGQTRAIGP